MILELTFAVIFVAGPAAFWVLSKQDATRRYFIVLWVATVGLLAGAYGIGTYGINLSLGAFHTGLIVLVAYWLSWIGMLSLIMLAVKRQVASTAVRRVAFAIGAIATTLPWFGLYAARMLAE